MDDNPYRSPNEEHDPSLDWLLDWPSDAISALIAVLIIGCGLGVTWWFLGFVLAL